MPPTYATEIYAGELELLVAHLASLQ